MLRFIVVAVLGGVGVVRNFNYDLLTYVSFCC